MNLTGVIPKLSLFTEYKNPSENEFMFPKIIRRYNCSMILKLLLGRKISNSILSPLFTLCIICVLRIYCIFIPQTDILGYSFIFFLICVM